MKSAPTSPRLGTAALIVLALLLVTSVTFVVLVHRKVQEHRADWEGFVNYGSPITPGSPDTQVVTESRIEKPVFAMRTSLERLKFWYEEWAFATKEVLNDLAQLFHPADKPRGSTP
jgi:hypothetical protein